MISFNAPILSGSSVGNVKIGANIEIYYNELLSQNIYPEKYKLGQIDCFRIHIPKYLEIFFSSDNIVFAITALNKYENNYREVIFPNMTVEDINKISTLQLKPTEYFVDVVDEFSVEKSSIQGIIKGLSIVLTESKEIYDDYSDYPNDYQIWGIMVFDLRLVFKEVGKQR